MESVEQHAEQAFLTPVIELDNTRQIRSRKDYENVDATLLLARTNRKKLTEYFKGEPVDPRNPRPGEGLCHFTRKAWESANSLFNKFDQRLALIEQEGVDLLREYNEREAERVQKEQARKQRIADEGARKERERLQAEADKLAKKKSVEAQEKAAQLQAKAASVQAKEVYVTPPRVPESTKMKTRKTYKGRVTNKKAFIKAIAVGGYSDNLLDVHQGNLNKLAKAMDGVNPPPGVVFEEETLFVRGRG